MLPKIMKNGRLTGTEDAHLLLVFQKLLHWHQRKGRRQERNYHPEHSYNQASVGETPLNRDKTDPKIPAAK